VACLSVFFVFFRVILWPTIIAAGNSIRADPCHPWLAFMYFLCVFVFFSGQQLLPQAIQSVLIRVIRGLPLCIFRVLSCDFVANNYCRRQFNPC
jgi:hypothetical protein